MIPHDPVMVVGIFFSEKNISESTSQVCDVTINLRGRGHGKGEPEFPGWHVKLNVKLRTKTILERRSWVNTLIQQHIATPTMLAMPFPVTKKQVPPHTKDVLFSYAKEINQESFIEKRNALCSILLRIIQAPPPPIKPPKYSPETALPSRWFSGAFDHMLIWSIQSVATCKRVVPSLPGKFRTSARVRFSQA